MDCGQAVKNAVAAALAAIPMMSSDETLRTLPRIWQRDFDFLSMNLPVKAIFLFMVISSWWIPLTFLLPNRQRSKTLTGSNIIIPIARVLIPNGVAKAVELSIL